MNNIRMKATMSIVALLVVACSIQAKAQEKKITKKHVPQAVLNAFQKAYPDAKVEGYSTEKENGKTYYEVESMKGEYTLDVSYLSDGTTAEVEEGVAPNDLPSPVIHAVKAKYPKGKILRAEKRTADNAVTYEMRIRTGKTHIGLQIDPSGKIIKEHKAKSKKEEKEEKDENH
jgi:hypothetical protein